MNEPAWLNAAKPYLSLINGCDNTHGIPRNLLVRLAFEESSFLPEIINGTLKSSAGAVGMFQLMPKYFPNAGISIETDCMTAANLLKSLYDRFGDWQLALAAYNWGGGNVHHELTIDGGTPTLADMPQETQNYVREIVRDVPVPGILLTIPV